MTSRESLLINRADIAEALNDFQHQLEIERESGHPLKTEPSPPVPSVPSPPEEGLYLDDYGRVWVDGLELKEQPSALEFKLLEALYRRDGAIVGNEALIESVWGPLFADQDETNLRKLLSRLRRKLEPRSSGNSSRFIRNVRGRGYRLLR